MVTTSLRPITIPMVLFIYWWHGHSKLAMIDLYSLHISQHEPAINVVFVHFPVLSFYGEIIVNLESLATIQIQTNSTYIGAANHEPIPEKWLACPLWSNLWMLLDLNVSWFTYWMCLRSLHLCVNTQRKGKIVENCSVSAKEN